MDLVYSVCNTVDGAVPVVLFCFVLFCLLVGG